YTLFLAPEYRHDTVAAVYHPGFISSASPPLLRHVGSQGFSIGAALKFKHRIGAQDIGGFRRPMLSNNHIRNRVGFGRSERLGLHPRLGNLCCASRFVDVSGRLGKWNPCPTVNIRPGRGGGAEYNIGAHRSALSNVSKPMEPSARARV